MLKQSIEVIDSTSEFEDIIEDSVDAVD